MASLIFVSCQKEDDEKVPDLPKYDATTTNWYFNNQPYAKVELEGNSDNDKKIAEGIENEIKQKMPPAGSVFTLIFTEKTKHELIRSYNDDRKEVKSEFSIGRMDGINYLGVIENGIETEIYQLMEDNYLIRDFTKEYESSDYKIISATGGAKFTIPR